MKAALLVAHNTPLAVADVEPVLPLGFGQVLVKVLTAGICGAQLQEIRGEKGGPLPHLMGHEGCGIVEATGPGVSRVRVGDKVVMHWRKAAGIESDFPKYRFNHRDTESTEKAFGSVSSVPPWFTSGLVTTWAEQTICSENRLTPVPADTSPQLAALLGCSVSTALATVETQARWGERVLVVGCGGLGISLLGALEMVEPRRLVCCDLHEEKRIPAEVQGADFINLTGHPISGGPFDLVLDTAGAPETMEAALEHLAPDGRYVLIGQPKPKAPVCIRAARHLFDGADGKQIRATQGGGFQPDRDIPRYLKIADSPMFYRLVSHVFPIDKINDALDLARTGHAGRIMIEFVREPKEQPKAA